jgi:hypothetical protein
VDVQLKRGPGVAPDDRTRRDAIWSFWIGAGFILMGAVILCIGAQGTARDLVSCVQACETASDMKSLWAFRLYWVSIGTGVLYLLLFGGWLARHWKPWKTINLITFSRVAWAGQKAHDQAWREVMHTVRDPGTAALTRVRYLAHLLLAGLTLALAGGLTIFINRCEACPSVWDDNCISSAATTAAVAGIMAFYYDMRIKFRRGAGSGEAVR